MVDDRKQLSDWGKQRARWVEMAGALARVPEPESSDPDCIEFKAEALHFAMLMVVPTRTPAEVADKIELATTREAGWEPTHIFWQTVLEDLRMIEPGGWEPPSDRPVVVHGLDLPTAQLPPAAYMDRLTKALLNAAIVASQVRGTDGKPIAMLQANPLIEALSGIMALVLGSSVECRTNQGARKVSEILARKIRLKLQDARDKGLTIEMHRVDGLH